MTAEPLLIAKADIPRVYGIPMTTVRHWSGDARLRRVKPGGPTGQTFFYRADIEALIAETTVPAGQKAGRGTRSKRR